LIPANFPPFGFSPFTLELEGRFRALSSASSHRYLRERFEDPPMRSGAGLASRRAASFCSAGLVTAFR
jgi:hypothetical protein